MNKEEYDKPLVFTPYEKQFDSETYSKKRDRLLFVPAKKMDEVEEPITPIDGSKPTQFYPSWGKKRPFEFEEAKKTLIPSERFQEGLRSSVSGELAHQVMGSPARSNKSQELRPEFWGSLTEMSGELIGDSPYIAAGATLGGILGTSLGSIASPFGAAVGGTLGAGAGAMALPTFLKESLKEYRNFQDKGGDLTYGEFLESADQVASKTLQSGAMGSILGMVNRSMPLLRTIPGVNRLFNTRYVGPTLERGTRLTAETATASTIPAISQGELPTSEDIAKNALMISAMHATEIPSAYREYIKKGQRNLAIDLEFADKFEELGLDYPALQELQGKKNTQYKVNDYLIENLRNFDESFAKNIAKKVDKLSPEEYSSTYDAGSKLKDLLFDQLEKLKPVLPKEPTQANLPATLLLKMPNQVSVKQVQTPQTPQTPQIPIKKPIEPSIKDLPDPIKEVALELSPTTYSSDVQAGKEIQKVYHETRAKEYKPFNERFKNLESETELYKLTKGNSRAIANNCLSFIEEFGKTAAPNSPESLLVDQAYRLLNIVATVKDGKITSLKYPTISRIINTNRSIKSRPDYDSPHDLKKNLTKITSVVDNISYNRLYKVAPDTAKEFRQLNKDYSEFKNTFDNDEMMIFNKPTESSREIGSKFSEHDSFTQLIPILEKSSNGQKVLSTLRRRNWERNLGESPSESKINEIVEMLSPEQRKLASKILEAHKFQKEKMQRELLKNKQIEEAEKQKKLSEKKTQQQTKQEENRRIKEAKTLEHKKIQEEKKRVYEEKKRIQEEKKHIQEENKFPKKNQSEIELLVSLLRRSPENLIDGMDTISGIKEVKEATKNLEGGTNLFNSLAKFKTSQMFDFMRVAHAKTGRIPYDELKIKLHDKDFRAKLEELNGKEFVKSMDELVSLTDRLSHDYKNKNFHKNKSQEIDETTIALALSIPVFGAKSAFLGYGAKKLLEKDFINYYSKQRFDSTKLKQFVEYARVLKSGNKEKIKELSRKIRLSIGSIVNDKEDNE